MKKIILALGTAGAVLTVLPLFAAFEAHVVNVTATIENALQVPLKHIDYGTVFPQEFLIKELGVRLSDSFLREDRVDDVEYFIRQKPKCGITSNNGTVLDHSSTATGHVSVGPDGQVVVDCGQPPRPLQTGESWGVLPLLCPYLSKHERSTDGQGENDPNGQLPAFHKPWVIDANGNVVWKEVSGRLAKSEQDIDDLWLIDLAVPRFGGYCAQDWADFVHRYNQEADPNQYTQPIENEHKVFGCDLWLEVSHVSEFEE